MPDESTPLDVSLTIATEQVAWVKKAGLQPHDILEALGEEIPAHASWDYVTGRVAAAWRILK